MPFGASVLTGRPAWRKAGLLAYPAGDDQRPFGFDDGEAPLPRDPSGDPPPMTTRGFGDRLSPLRSGKMKSARLGATGELTY